MSHSRLKSRTAPGWLCILILFLFVCFLFLFVFGSSWFYYVLLRSMPMLSCFSDVLLLCFSASIASRLFVLFLILCFSAFCFPCFSEFVPACFICLPLIFFSHVSFAAVPLLTRSDLRIRLTGPIPYSATPQTGISAQLIFLSSGETGTGARPTPGDHSHRPPPTSAWDPQIHNKKQQPNQPPQNNTTKTRR